LMLALLTVLLAVPTAGLAKVKIVATLTDLAWIAAEVGGDDVDVTVLCPGHRDPHSLPAKPSLARKMRKADLLVYNGLELEIGWLPTLVDAARNPKIRSGQPGELNCSLALGHDDILEVPTGEVDRSHGDVHTLGNPHYLLDPRLGVAVARLMADRLAELDPDAAERYRTRAEDLAVRVDSRLASWEALVRASGNGKIIAYHQNWEYLAHWLGLEIIAIIENRPGISPAPRHVEQVIVLGQSQHPRAVVAATWDHVDGARHVAGKVGCGTVVLPGATGGTDAAVGYLELFDTIIAQLADSGGDS